MNERIEIVRDNLTYIRRIVSHDCRIAVELLASGYVSIGGIYYDDDGLRALLDVINCKLSTGSFAAMSDTSAVPFCGKRMRWHTADDGDHEVTILAVGDTWSRLVSHKTNASYVPENKSLLPLTEPAPQEPVIRPWTPVDAAVHIGRLIKSDIGSAGRMESVLSGRAGVSISKILGTIVSTFDEINFVTLAEHWAFADDSTPCGIEVTPTT